MRSVDDFYPLLKNACERQDARANELEKKMSVLEGYELNPAVHLTVKDCKVYFKENVVVFPGNPPESLARVVWWKDDRPFSLESDPGSWNIWFARSISIQTDKGTNDLGQDPLMESFNHRVFGLNDIDELVELVEYVFCYVAALKVLMEKKSIILQEKK